MLPSRSNRRVSASALYVASALLVVGSFGVQAVGEAPPSPAAAGKASAAPADARSSERGAVRAAMDSFVKAFESRDAKALAAHWTAEGEYKNEQGVTTHGRESLEKGFAEFFAKTPEVKAEVHPESLRFLSRESAIEEGTVQVRRGPTAPPSTARYSALFAREDGRWRIAQLSEAPAEEKSSIADLGWLVGDWKTTGAGGAEIHTNYSWAANKKFLVVHFTIKEKDLALAGSQVIGVDPATGGMHTWTFEADGGVGEADWTRDGDHWTLEVVGTLADGRTLTETNVLRRINDDTFTWQSVDRRLGDADLPDLAPVKVTRVKSAK